MPLTPFHLGPALAVKAAAPNRFGIAMFAFTQAIMDSEVVLAIFIGKGAIHGLLHFHTFPGAIAIAALSVGIGLPAGRWLARRWNLFGDQKLGKFSWVRPEVSLFAAISGALAGGFSHVFLDAIINTDVAPFAPFSEANPFYGLMSRGTLHLALTALGAIGVAMLAGAYMRRTSQKRRVQPNFLDPESE